ncbi:uncharacterized protein DNG_08719 [Cephalotrichum gorgonifer]|uniref:Uncharacterized protein n=1 Tax=Cephalotrichum gorgonifer TaxID=2041049 RepID=A0AAE8SYM4_9PEZI|nr:uncharacterized protein DNG_08719 [Cephalotrichum gorgonifer]
MARRVEQVISVVANGNFTIELSAPTFAKGYPCTSVVKFLVSRRVFFQNCDNIDLEKVGHDTYTLSFSNLEAARATEILLAQMHCGDPASCPDWTCREWKLEPVRQWFWIVRIQAELGARSVCPEAAKDWFFQFEKDGLELSTYEDWYLLGPIARHMGIGYMGNLVAWELQNNCIIDDDGNWVGKDGKVLVPVSDFPGGGCTDRYYMDQMGSDQRNLNDVKRRAFIAAIDATAGMLAAFVPGDSVSLETFDKWARVGVRYCKRCPKVDCTAIEEGLIDVGMGPTDADLPLAAMVRRIELLRRRLSNTEGSSHVVDVSIIGCDALKHLVELGCRLMELTVAGERPEETEAAVQAVLDNQ